MPLKINGSTSGSVTLAAPATGSDVTLTLPTTAIATLASPSFTGNLVWSGATLRADTATVSTSQTTSSTSFTDLSTSGAAVTVTTGTKALVIIQASGYNSGASYTNYVGVAVSGASTVAAGDVLNLAGSGSNWWQGSAALLMTGLTAGSNTFTMKYKVNVGTGTFAYRAITVIDMGS